MKISEIIDTIEAFAPANYQESWDNTGLQVGDRNAECSGVMICVDVTPDVVDEAISRGCNMIVSHHPLLFHGLKTITGATPVEKCVMRAIAAGISIYSSHTAVDNTPGGVSHVMAQKLNVNVDAVLDPLASQPGGQVGTGVVGNLTEPLTPSQLIDRVKKAFGSPIARCTNPELAPENITRIAMCGGSGGSLINAAIDAGAQAYITSDTRYHDFVDHRNSILIIDIGHFESEQCTKDIFYRIISQKFANFAVYNSQSESNSILYL